MVENSEVPRAPDASRSDRRGRSVPNDPSDRVARERAPERSVDGDERPREYGGRKGPEPTRYGDWEKNGRCIDF
ncbi:DUF1674 domain-containing protein [Wenzhouxiangella sp. XN79A]|uniref:DUF1674 domain-containing protein n=1 Tax=Wenzhouxiangella sp. XN79A TaxID=2724193 RepID=UPI00144A50AD|nr:succinate dehydrogenase assembly factor 4 [Wenzhouxiangella sp. XN79A]NKI35473.1 DUF1674 domain-containing protein [Wenzhouxiangella sp. XN79A]